MATRALSTTCAYVCLAAAPVSHAPRSSKSAAPRVAASRAAARLSSKVPHPPPPEFGSLGECARTIRWLGSTAEAALCLNTTRPLDPMRRCAPGSCNALLGAAGMLTAVDTDRRTHTTPQRAATLCSREQHRVRDDPGAHGVGVRRCVSIESHAWGTAAAPEQPARCTTHRPQLNGMCQGGWRRCHSPSNRFLRAWVGPHRAGVRPHED
jgi:hypothetical protein